MLWARLLRELGLPCTLPHVGLRMGRIRSEGSLSKPRIIQHDGIRATLGHFGPFQIRIHGPRSNEIEQSYWMRAINWTHGL